MVAGALGRDAHRRGNLESVEIQYFAPSPTLLSSLTLSAVALRGAAAVRWDTVPDAVPHGGLRR
jgi:hypothetical protein